MSRLPTLTPRKVIAALKRDGFVESGFKGGHQYFWHPTKRVFTTVPMHPGDVDRKLLKEIIKQALLTEEEFRGLLYRNSIQFRPAAGGQNTAEHAYARL